MAEYKVDNGRILHMGYIYTEGDVIDLDDSVAERLGQYISPVGKAAPVKDKEQSNDDEQGAAVDYEEYTIAELKKLVDKENVDVKPTGKKGSAVKSDYIRALTQSK
ncbi:hypothetical protein [Staphylococcus sp. LKG3-3]|uniref:hypothetical protein n=1 Tax=Staphylococcus sp. LKG3-3 TaxID=3399685 RepID=UPI003D4DD3FF